jgi:hypothetical protein
LQQPDTWTEPSGAFRILANGLGADFAAGEIANVTRAFHPSGRFCAPNS